MELRDLDLLADLYPVPFPLLAVLCELQPVVAHRRVELAVGAAEVAADIVVVVAEEAGMLEVVNTMFGERNLDAVVGEAVGSVAGLEEVFVAEAVEGN